MNRTGFSTAHHHSIMRAISHVEKLPRNMLFCFVLLQGVTMGAEHNERATPPKQAPIPTYRPASQPVVRGEFAVGVVTITFRDTALVGTLADQLTSLNIVKGRHDESGATAPATDEPQNGNINLKEYFKIYSNDITWPSLTLMPGADSCYKDPQFYGYYCEYDYWENPLGWKTTEEGSDRVQKMNKEALRFAEKNYRGSKPRFLCYNYITTRPEILGDDVTRELLVYYTTRDQPISRKLMRKARKNPRNQDPNPDKINPWELYRPECRWGDPMWPNSKIQVTDGSGGVLTHELGHCLGAPDVYRIGRHHDGISGDASLMPYGPTANAFSRFYHHAFINETNHPTLTKSGSYTLHPRHIKPTDKESLGFLIPSNHPHYFYHVEYIYNEGSIVGVGPGVEGMLISVVNLGLSNYLGSPDYFYVYRPNDPFFRGLGDTNHCLFGASHHRTEFNMKTEPSSRLPNLLDGGVSIKNIQEHQGTLTFDLEINKQPVTGNPYTLSMLPQIRLDAITDIQPTSFTMDCTIKFRGEPLKTIYGFCWSKSAAPTIRDSTYALAHRECYRGHAINLDPDSTYHVRSFASNGLGYRYSDEEKIVKTPPIRQAPSKIGPLLTDSFSNNDYLYQNYSQDRLSGTQEFANYSPMCALAKLIAYYRPSRFMAANAPDKSADPVDFNQMSWNPTADDFPMRLDEVDGFFQALKSRSKELELYEVPGKDFIRNLVKLTGVRSKPVLNNITADNLEQISGLIRNDLANSRPSIVILHTEHPDAEDMICWGLVDGIDETGKFHLDMPQHSQITRDGELVEFPTRYLSARDLLIPRYKTYLVSSCYYPR